MTDPKSPATRPPGRPAMARWILAWLALATAAVGAAAGSCSINHRSGSFECETAADCDAGRTCSDGLCVVGPRDSGVPDAAKKDGGVGDAAVCPPGCTSCAPGKVCIIDCSAAGGACNSQVVCPIGWNCDIRCNTANSCRNGVNCTGGASCNLQCTGTNSCRGVACGPGACSVGCTANGSCESVACGASCACDVRCSLGSSCLTVLCTRAECDTGRGCSSTTSSLCYTCP